MKNWTEKELIAEGYRIENVRIEGIDLSMADHGCMCLAMPVSGRGWGTTIGGYSLGHGYLGSDTFYDEKGSMEYIMRIMDVIGVERFKNAEGKYIRVATKGNGSVVIFGNIIKDKWFDQRSFFEEFE